MVSRVSPARVNRIWMSDKMNSELVSSQTKVPELTILFVSLRERPRGRVRCGGNLGESPAIQAVRDNMRRLVGRPTAGQGLPAILVQGQTGTGKVLVARLIHRAGPRANGPFVDVNCAALFTTRLDSG